MEKRKREGRERERGHGVKGLSTTPRPTPRKHHLVAFRSPVKVADEEQTEGSSKNDPGTNASCKPI